MLNRLNRARRALFALVPQLALAAVVAALARGGPRWLEALARREPDPSRRRSQDGLRLARVVLAPSAPATAGLLAEAGGLTTEPHRPSNANHGRPAPPPGFYLAGAVRAERLGRTAEAAPWLALGALARGDRIRGENRLTSTPAARQPLTIETDVLMERVRRQLEKEHGRRP